MNPVEQHFLGVFLIGRRFSGDIVAAACEEREQHACLHVIRKTTDDLAECVGGGFRAIGQLFEQSVAVIALDRCADAVFDERYHAFGGGVAVGDGFGRAFEQGHDHAPVGEQAIRVIAHRCGKVAGGFEFPSEVKMVEAHVHMGLCRLARGGDG